MENIMTPKPLILLIGPSGSGKTTLANALSRDYGLRQLASYTDRPRRSPDEIGHTFVSPDEFNKLRPDMAAYNVFNGHQYGATYQQLDQTDIYVVDIPGYWDLMRHYRNRPFITFVLGATSTVCARRMRRRGDSDEMIQKRLENDAKAFAGMCHARSDDWKNGSAASCCSIPAMVLFIRLYRLRPKQIYLKNQ